MRTRTPALDLNADRQIAITPGRTLCGLLQTVSWLRATLWALLANMEEELSVATSSTLSLLAALYSAPAAVIADATLATQLPILWPFLSHTLTSVRLAAATCLASIVAAKDAAGWAEAEAAAAVAAAGGDEATVAAASAAMAAAGAGGAGEAGSWLQSVVGPCLRIVLQSLVLEKAESVRQMLLQAWRALLQHSRAPDVAAGLSVRDMRAMLNVLCTPCGQGLDTAVLVVPLQRRLVPWSSQEAELAGLVTRPAKRVKSDPAAARSMNGMGPASQGSAGGSAGGSSSVAGCAVDPEGWPGMNDPQAAVHTRLLASRALAELCHRLAGQVRELQELARHPLRSCVAECWSGQSALLKKDSFNFVDAGKNVVTCAICEQLDVCDVLCCDTAGASCTAWSCTAAAAATGSQQQGGRRTGHSAVFAAGSRAHQTDAGCSCCR